MRRTAEARVARIEPDERLPCAEAWALPASARLCGPVKIGHRLGAEHHGQRLISLRHLPMNRRDTPAACRAAHGALGTLTLGKITAIEKVVRHAATNARAAPGFQLRRLSGLR